MFINFWYVAEESKNVTEQPTGVRMLGQDFVLFRDSNGQARCLSDVCVHRGGSLAVGTVHGDCVECRYHGWRYDGDGHCVEIPSLGADAKIPARAKVDSYPTMEKYDLVFAFLGDLSADERPPISEIPDWGAEGWRSNFMRFEFDFDYKRSLENGVDLAHNEFTHSFQLFKNPDGTRFPIPDIDLDYSDNGWGMGIHMTMPGANTGLRGKAGKTEPGPTEVYTGFHGVSSIRTFINFRSYLTDADHDAQSVEENTAVVIEDLTVLTPLRPAIAPRTAVKELLMPADKPVVAYRERLQEFEAKGWRIDNQQVKDNRDKLAYAIPSPGRRESRNWVIDAVPLIAATAEPSSKVAQA
jgi:nitrite reductase/ring-hydroxylating ferredoxin subunit